MKFKIPLHIIELEAGNFHLIAKSDFSDGTSGNWVIDTGASKTVFDKNLAGKYSVSEDETEEIHTAGITDKLMETTVGNLYPFSLGKMEIENFKVALLDLSHINKLYSKAANLEICGLIGGDFLMKFKAIIDYKRQFLILQT